MTHAHETLRQALLFATTATLLLALTACGGADERAAPAPATTLVDLEVEGPVPSATDSGTQVNAAVTVRTTEPQGVRVWFLPYANDGEDLPRYAYAGSPLETGPDLTVDRYFRVVVGDENGRIAGFRVVAHNVEGELVLDERVPNPVTIRSLASTRSLTLTPPSGSLEQEQRVNVEVTFQLDQERDVHVGVIPVPGDVDGHWRYAHFQETFMNATSGTMTGWFTVSDAVEGTAPVDRVRVQISDLASGTIYWRFVDVDLVFTEPTP